MKFLECPDCDFITLHKQALSCHKSKEHTNEKMLYAMYNFQNPIKTIEINPVDYYYDVFTKKALLTDEVFGNE